MDRKLNIGLYGSAGHQIGLKDYENETHIAAVCAVSDGFKKALEENGKTGFKVYETLEEMLADEEIDLISLCSPQRSEQEGDAIRCLNAGKHVYAEKPAAFTEDGIGRILDAAKKFQTAAWHRRVSIT